MKTAQQHVSYEYLWIRRTCDYILVECMQFSSTVRVRIGLSVWLVSGYALLSVVICIVPIAATV